MRRTDDDRFRARPGKPRQERDPGVQRFTRQVLRAARKTGAGAGPALRRTSGRGAEKGRGLVAARLVGDRLGPRSRRVVVKARLVVHAQAAPGTTAAHIRYIQRDSVTREGERGELYSADRDAADGDAFERRLADDRHEFRFIVSPEDAAEIGDLRSYTRDLMARMEADLEMRLDWVAVDHWDTDNPHTHVVLRGVDDAGGNLVIARDYISHGLRGRASELATEWLGPQTEREIAERLTREVGQERWTGLDRRLAGLAHDGRIDLAELDRHAPADQRGALVGRVQTLERLGLAERIDDGVWRVPADFLDRAAAHEASRSTSAAVGLRSHLDVKAQARSLGATWLDRELIADARPAAVGFGAEVRAALTARADFLEEQGLASRRGQRLVLARDLIATLRAHDVAAAGGRIAAETGLDHRHVGDGERVSGTYRRSVMLASGRFAMLDDGVGFSLVPWQPVVEQRLGQAVSAVMRGRSVLWDLSRHRGLGI